MRKLMEFIATGFYSGKLPKMPGTWGSILAGVLLYFFWYPSLAFQVAVVVVISALSVLTSGAYTLSTGEKDPGCVVIDEMAGVALALLGFEAKGNITLVVLAVALFRVVDILKPPPLRTAESLKGGFGITADDLLAGAIVNAILRMLGFR